MNAFRRCVGICMLAWLGSQPVCAEEISFNRDIRPILSANCYACHGPDEQARQADLRLDHFEGATADLGGHKALAPGDPDASEMLKRIVTDDADLLMPPIDSGHRLDETQKRLIRDWIAGGGSYNQHWAFVPPIRPALPATTNSDWSVSPIDAFVLSRMEQAGLHPSPQADPYTLLRRVSLDLTGLPPTIEQADAFAANPTAENFAQAVDRLLESNRFGEHWGRMWLDLARYADTKGYEKDRPRTIWRYRDWVIDAFNQDMPLDQFTLHQLAGDLIADATPDTILATAFHRNTMVNEEGGTDDEEFRVAAVKDRVDTTIQVWMGLTMGCAKCHSHKYDPISIEDYYALYAVFNQTQDRDLGNESPTMLMPTREQAAQIASIKSQIDGLQANLQSKPDGYEQAYAQWESQILAKGNLWQPLSLADFTSDSGVTLKTDPDGTLVAVGEKPASDQWLLTLNAPQTDQPITALRLDILPPSMTSSQWNPDNITVHFTVDIVVPDEKPQRINFKNARATFQQSGWDAGFAVGKDASKGWALGGKQNEPNAAVFDLDKPQIIPANAVLQVRMTFPYKNHLIVNALRMSLSTMAADLLGPEIDPKEALRERFLKSVHPVTRQISEQIKDLEQRRAQIQNEIPDTPVMQELPVDKRRVTHVHLRGNFLDQAEEVVQPGLPEVFVASRVTSDRSAASDLSSPPDSSIPSNSSSPPDSSSPSDQPIDRIAVAQWLCSDSNPLTARVMVNRVWARLFGTGIVETEEDFGSQGTYPSHPQLLDWLAVDYRENGWSLKSLLKTIVLSRAYQQAAVVDADRLQKDPRNRWLSRGPRFRLTAETVRDQALAASGLLTHQIGGPSVFPPQPPGIWKSTYSDLKWNEAADADRYRRGLYTFLKRTSPHPAMLAFDAGSGEVCQIRRIRTNTPMQSLVTLNDKAFFETAGALAAKMIAASDQLDEQIAHGFRRVMIRKPDAAEIERLVQLYHSVNEDLVEDQLLSAAGVQQGDPAMITVANVILNLDETLTKP